MAQERKDPNGLPERPRGKTPLLRWRTAVFNPGVWEYVSREELDGPPPPLWRRIWRIFW